MIITISGLHGTGKTVVGKKIAETLGIRYYSTGEAFRALAKDRNLSLEEFTKYVEKNPEIDQQLDNKILEIARNGNIIVDSQLSGYLLESIADLKILLTCPLEIRVKRMAKRDKISYEKKMKETILRERSEQKRFKILYNIDLTNIEKAKEIYDLIIATEALSIKEVLKNILDLIKNRKLKKS
ncbi:MAG: (d)CMP kinase [Promethearchaeota archaeon]